MDRREELCSKRMQSAITMQESVGHQACNETTENPACPAQEHYKKWQFGGRGMLYLLSTHQTLDTMGSRHYSFLFVALLLLAKGSAFPLWILTNANPIRCGSTADRSVGRFGRFVSPRMDTDLEPAAQGIGLDTGSIVGIALGVLGLLFLLWLLIGLGRRSMW
jgi:hypothetical protein